MDGIELRGVGFRYPGTDREVLTDVTLRLPAGAVVALVGVNGAGESSLVKLLCGLLRPERGSVTLDGVDLADIDPIAWQARVSALFQDFARLQFSVRATVGSGDLPRLWDQAAIRESIRRRSAVTVGAVTLVVSHRLATVCAADLIVVLADGQVVESGDHATLMTAGGPYAEMFRIQAAAHHVQR